MPLVSVIMPSYNHAKFIEQSINSVLAQSYKDFEFLIFDDGSTDETHAKLRNLQDNRLKIILNKKNRGAAVIHSELIEASCGKYIALINSDDTWRSDKLAIQVDFLERNPEYCAFFSNAQFIDEFNQPLEEANFPYYNVFKAGNRSQAEWIRKLFLEGNCLCHPSSLIRRGVYDEIGGYDNALRQLPDYFQWIKFTKRFQLFISEEKLINFRVINSANASAPTSTNNMRIMNEHFLIANTVLEGIEHSLFREAFNDMLKRPDRASPLDIEIEKAFLFFTPVHTLSRVYRIVGLQRLYTLLSNPESRQLLETEYRFDHRAFHELMGQRSPFINDDISNSDQNYNYSTVSLSILLGELRKRAKRRLRRSLKFR